MSASGRKRSILLDSGLMAVVNPSVMTVAEVRHGSGAAIGEMTKRTVRVFGSGIASVMGRPFIDRPE